MSKLTDGPLEGIDACVLELVAGVIQSHLIAAGHSHVDPKQMAIDCYAAHQQYIDCCLQRYIDLAVDPKEENS